MKTTNLKNRKNIEASDSRLRYFGKDIHKNTIYNTQTEIRAFCGHVCASKIFMSKLQLTLLNLLIVSFCKTISPNEEKYFT